MNIRKIRKNRGMTQAELAHKVGVDQTAVSQWETDNVMPRSSKIPNIAKMLGCSIEELFEDEVTL